VAVHVASANGVLLAEFCEVETGTNKKRRPEIAAALAACRLRRATLVIGKLDRLARNVYFISGLMESGVDFVACDNPYATPLLIHILAAVAEDEAKRIAQRTKDALAVVRRELVLHGSWLARRSGRRITRLGNPHLKPGDRRATFEARRVRSARADQFAADVVDYIEAARKAGCASNGEIARALTARGIETPGGGREWSRAQVARVLARVAYPRDERGPRAGQ